MSSSTSCIAVFLLVFGVSVIHAQYNTSLCLKNNSTPFPLWTLMKNPKQCDPGFYCPNLNASNPSTWPTLCTPTDDCMVNRLQYLYCDRQGLYDPILCPVGYYCPVGGLLKFPCPIGHFCPLGTVTPRECELFSFCLEEGTQVRLYYGSMLITMIVDVALIIAIVRYVACTKPMQNEKIRKNMIRKWMRGKNEMQKGGHNQRVLPKYVQTMCQYFARARHDYVISQLPSSSTSSSSNASSLASSCFTLDFAFTALSLSIPSTTPSSSSSSSPSSPWSLLKLLSARANEGASESRTSSDNDGEGAAYKTILRSVTGTIVPGKVTAILGPSGAGKTSFFNCLMGKIDDKCKIGGSCTINGKQGDVQKYKQIIGFVPQEDTMLRELTVYEIIKFSADTRLPRNWSNASRSALVSSIICALNLAHVADRRIGDVEERGVSGGERKRVNIAIELAAAPAALFLDEPTSGLDAATSLSVCRLLSDLCCHAQLTVAMIIHQPRIEIWEQLEKLIILAPGGRTVYEGPQRVCLSYFVNHLRLSVRPNDNPADVIMDAVSQFGDSYADMWSSRGVDLVSSLTSAFDHDHDNFKQQHLHQHRENNDDDDDDDDNDEKNKHDTDVAVMVESYQNQNQNQNQNPQRDSNHSDDLSVVAVDAVAGDVVDIDDDDDDDNAAAQNKEDQGTSHERGASFFHLLYLIHNRNVSQQLAKWTSLIQEILVGSVAGAIMGASAHAVYQGILIPPYTLLSASAVEWSIPQSGMYIGMAISVCSAAAGVRIFHTERTVYWRESASTSSSSSAPWFCSSNSPSSSSSSLLTSYRAAYFIGVTWARIYTQLLAALHFATLFHFLSANSMNFGILYVLVFLQFWATYGIAAIVSQLTRQENGALIAVVVSLILSCFNGYAGLPKMILYLTGGFWMTEAMYDQLVDPFSAVMQVEQISAPFWGYTLHRVPFDVFMIVVIGISARIIAFFCMIGLHRDKQR